MARKRMRRAEAFLGVHFDFHAGMDCTEVGKTLTGKMVGEMLDLIKPDYVQCDCKGHPGIASWPTKVGTAAPGIVRDPLKIWRAETAKRGVGLFMHYSGVWDAAAIRGHGEWARVDENGKADAEKTSVFGAYVDELMIPQLVELRQTYGVDGAWIDGDCWAVQLDYSKPAVAAFAAATGIAEPPKKAGEAHWEEWRAFCREAFRKYLRHWVDEVHARAPGMELASNWAYSSFMPEPVNAAVDFLSGDYALMDSYNSARLEARCLALQERPWDLMAWAFAGTWEDKCRSTKSALQLKQEAAAVLSVGGGFQAYFTQNRDASIKTWQMKVMGEVAKFCRAREKVCHKSAPVPVVGMVFSSAGYYQKTPQLFTAGGSLKAMGGVLDCVLDGQQVVDLLMDHHVSEGLAAYELVIVPEWEHLSADVRVILLSYVRGGGKLLVIGAGAAKGWVEELGVSFEGEVAEGMRWIDSERGWLSGVKSKMVQVRLGRGTEGIGKLWAKDDQVGEAWPAASVRKLGQGEIAGIYYGVGERYRAAGTHGLRDFVRDVIRRLVPKPMVEVTGSRLVDVTLQRKGERLMVNLTNTSGPHADYCAYTFDEIPAVGRLTVKLRLAKKPRRVTWEPEGKKLAVKWAKGVMEVVVPRLEVHGVVVVET